MEVLGIASSIAGLVSLADVIAFRVSTFYTLAKGAHSDIKAPLVKIKSLYGDLNDLKLLASCLEAERLRRPYTGPKVPEMDRLLTCRANLDHLKRILGKFDLDSSKPLDRVRVKLMWLMRSTETAEFIDKLARNKRDLANALTSDGLTILLNMLSSQSKLAETVEDVHLHLQQMTERKQKVSKMSTRGKSLWGDRRWFRRKSIVTPRI